MPNERIILTVVGARPQFIKASAVSRCIENISDCREIIVHTGQHYDREMSDVFFEELSIQKPQYNLGVGSSSHGLQTGNMLIGIEEILLKEKPDIVLTYGDTNSTLAAALASTKLHIPVAHVEAGLRSFNRKMPEEINRILTDHISDILYIPTKIAESNLIKEGIDNKKIKYVGDVMYDSAIFFTDADDSSCTNLILKEAKVNSKEYILATIHRAENTDNPEKLTAIFNGLLKVANILPIVLPLHPRTRKALNSIGLIEDVVSKLRILPPIGYLDMLSLEKHSRLIVTDSGGVQKEAFFHRVPCVTLREETEWIELVNSGWNTLVVPSDEHTVYEIVLSATKKSIPKENKLTSNLYGNGQAAHEIARHLESFLIPASK